MSIEFRFAAAVDRVFALMTDADFLVDRCLALGELSAECTIEDVDDEIVVTLSTGRQLSGSVSRKSADTVVITFSRPLAAGDALLG